MVNVSRLEALVASFKTAATAKLSVLKLVSQTIAIEFCSLPSNATFQSLLSWKNEISKVMTKLLVNEPKSVKSNRVAVSKAVTVCLNDGEQALVWAQGDYSVSLDEAYNKYRNAPTESLPSLNKVMAAIFSGKYSVQDIIDMHDALTETHNGDVDNVLIALRDMNKKQKAA